MKIHFGAPTPSKVAVAFRSTARVLADSERTEDIMAGEEAWANGKWNSSAAIWR